MKIFLPLMGACASFAVLALMLRTRVARLALDHPNDRSLHSQPTPRVGGIAIFAVLTPLLFFAGLPLLGTLTGALSAVSFLDDRFQLGISLRFASHAIAAFVFVWIGLGELNLLPALCVVFALMWMTNLFNFMDGSDGLAGGMAILGFASYGIAAWLGQNEVLSIAAFCVSGCAASFLCFNFPPAKVFLGDAGSIPLGFLAAAMGLLGWDQGIWPLWFPLLVFSPFIIDATVTLMRRGLHCEKIWQAHRNHYYQRLIQSGWNHRKTALAAYGLMFLCGAFAVVLIRAEPFRQRIVLLVVALLYMVLGILIDRAWRRHQSPDEIS